MGNSTVVAAGPKKVVVRKAAAKKVAAKKAAARKTTAKKAAPVARQRAKARTKPSLPNAQARVVASKFAGPETAPKRKPRPSLPSTYGESRVLLLARDPHTLFAAWDMSREAVEGLKARIGNRSFAVSTLTLRMTPAGGLPSIFHLEKRARSRYLRIEGGASFVAEIGFTTPSGRFEFVARSAPCSVPLGIDRGDPEGETSGRSVVSYRNAITLLRRGEALRSPGKPGRANGGASGSARKATPPPLASARVLGGASDLYRR
jgi:hypothetical protein